MVTIKGGRNLGVKLRTKRSYDVDSERNFSNEGRVGTIKVQEYDFPEYGRSMNPQIESIL